MGSTYFLCQETFTEMFFSSENHGIYGQMAVQAKQGLSQLDKKIIGILLIAILAIVLTASISYYIYSQPNQTQNVPSPTPTQTPEPTPTPSPSEEPTEPASIPKPSVPEFTVEFFDSSYDVPTTYSTDPYTGETVTHEGYHVESRTIEVKIKNEPFVSYWIQNSSSGANWSINFYYNIRIKGHFSEDWNELYNPEGYIHQDSGAEYTVRTYDSGESVYAIDTGSKRIEFPANAQVDFQVEALIGYTHRVIMGPMYVPWVFTGEKSGWSETLTITLP